MFVWGKDDLNPEQEKAIYNENSILLIACPGSGKTRTITYKIAYELSKLESNKQYIVAITYTNRAADEIKERIELLGVDTEQLWIGTIHSFCVEWILKPYHMYIEELRFGYDIINTNDTENYLVSLCASYSTPKKKITYWDCLCYCFTSEGLKINCTKPTIKETVELIIYDYYQNLKEKHEIDYELILYYSYCLLKENQSICKTLSNIFPYILIDEYQDTKELQYMILGAILKTGKENKAFIVGDPNQSIYGNLGGFPMDKAQLESVTGLYYDELSLSNNYRSSSLLVSYWHFDAENGTVSNLPMAITDWHHEILDGIQVYISNAVEKEIQTMVEASPDKETGGCLFGSYDRDHNSIYVYYMVPAPEDSIHTPVSFVRGFKGLTTEYERITKLTYHQVRYLGEWHSHPDMPNTPSSTDKKQFEELCKEQQSQDLPFVQMIHGNNGLFITAVM